MPLPQRGLWTPCNNLVFTWLGSSVVRTLLRTACVPEESPVLVGFLSWLLSPVLKLRDAFRGTKCVFPEVPRLSSFSSP